MTTLTKESEIFVADKPFETWFLNSAGDICSEFLTELRDNKRILGIVCPECGRVLVPARPTCATCFRQTEGWKEVSHKGTVISYTAVYEPLPSQEEGTPTIYGIILLDGADTGLVHMLEDVDPKDISIGLRVQAVFREERKGDIGDIRYFKPIK
jgi:uncharacterized protein